MESRVESRELKRCPYFSLFPANSHRAIDRSVRLACQKTNAAFCRLPPYLAAQRLSRSCISHRNAEEASSSSLGEPQPELPCAVSLPFIAISLTQHASLPLHTYALAGILSCLDLREHCLLMRTSRAFREAGRTRASFCPVVEIAMRGEPPQQSELNDVSALLTLLEGATPRVRELTLVGLITPEVAQRAGKFAAAIASKGHLQSLYVFRCHNAVLLPLFLQFARDLRTLHIRHGVAFSDTALLSLLSDSECKLEDVSVCDTGVGSPAGIPFPPASAASVHALSLLRSPPSPGPPSRGLTAAHIAPMTRLTKLQLTGGDLQSSAITAIAGLPHLTRLWLQHVPASLDLRPLSASVSLQTFGMDVQFPCHAGRLSFLRGMTLTSLYVSGLKMADNDAVLEEVSGVAVASRSACYPLWPVQITNLPELKDLAIDGGGHCSGNWTFAMAGCPKLEFLYLNMLFSNDPDCWKLLSASSESIAWIFLGPDTRMTTRDIRRLHAECAWPRLSMLGGHVLRIAKEDWLSRLKLFLPDPA